MLKYDILSYLCSAVEDLRLHIVCKGIVLCCATRKNCTEGLEPRARLKLQCCRCSKWRKKSLISKMGQADVTVTRHLHHSSLIPGRAIVITRAKIKIATHHKTHLLAASWRRVWGNTRTADCYPSIWGEETLQVHYQLSHCLTSCLVRP